MSQNWCCKKSSKYPLENLAQDQYDPKWNHKFIKSLKEVKLYLLWRQFCKKKGTKLKVGLHSKWQYWPILRLTAA